MEIWCFEALRETDSAKNKKKKHVTNAYSNHQILFCDVLECKAGDF